MIRRTSIALSAAAAASFLVVGCTRAQDAGFGDKVHAYLMAHPEVIEEAVQKLQEQKDQQSQLKAKAALQHDRQSLERDPRDFVANPNGKVTVTEFYDYRCPHCIDIAPKVVNLIRQHPNVRFVFKEMPIFGDTSEHAADAALAAKEQGKDYVGLYEAMMAARPLTDETIDQLATAKGVDVKAMNAPATQARYAAQIADIAALAGKLHIVGTPGFVVGDVIIPGEDYDALQVAITRAEAKA